MRSLAGNGSSNGAGSTTPLPSLLSQPPLQLKNGGTSGCAGRSWGTLLTCPSACQLGGCLVPCCRAAHRASGGGATTTPAGRLPTYTRRRRCSHAQEASSGGRCRRTRPAQIFDDLRWPPIGCKACRLQGTTRVRGHRRRASCTTRKFLLRRATTYLAPPGIMFGGPLLAVASRPSKTLRLGVAAWLRVHRDLQKECQQCGSSWWTGFCVGAPLQHPLAHSYHLLFGPRKRRRPFSTVLCSLCWFAALQGQGTNALLLHWACALHAPRQSVHGLRWIHCIGAVCIFLVNLYAILSTQITSSYDGSQTDVRRRKSCFLEHYVIPDTPSPLPDISLPQDPKHPIVSLPAVQPLPRAHSGPPWCIPSLTILWHFTLPLPSD